VVPWYVTVLDDPSVGGPLPWWAKLAAYLLLGGAGLALVSLAMEILLRRPEPAAGEVPGGPTDILLGNTDFVPGREIAESLGLVKGHTIYAIWLGKDISALLRLILGGELTEYTEMMGKARETATQRMIAQAAEMGADAIINTRYMTTSVVGTAAELFAYGTAVKLSQ